MLQPISEADFTAAGPFQRVLVHDHARRFAALWLPQASKHVVLSWRSDLIEPAVEVDPTTSETWIGVDQRLVCVSPLGTVHFSIALPSVLLQLQVTPQSIVALCELQVIAVNRDHSIRSLVDLPDVAESVVVQPDRMLLTLMDGRRRDIAF